VAILALSRTFFGRPNRLPFARAFRRPAFTRSTIREFLALEEHPCRISFQRDRSKLFFEIAVSGHVAKTSPHPASDSRKAAETETASAVLGFLSTA
jgi:hypothetical protein